jgi:pyruvate kinase
MTQIIEAVEDSPLIQVPLTAPQVRTKRFITKSICYHAAYMANEIKAKAISTLTNSGYTAFQISAWRPSAHILVYTSNRRILTQLNLLWGVNAFFYDKFVSTDDTVEDINHIAKENGYVKKGDILINLAAMPVVEKGMVNTLRISEIE